MKSKFIEYYNSLSLAEKESFTTGCIMCFNILGSSIDELKDIELVTRVLSYLIKEVDDVLNNRNGE